MLSEDEILFEERWIDTEICRACKGICCQRNACDNAPSDFDNDISLIEKALESGYYAIDFARKSAQSFITTSSGYLTLDVENIIKSTNETLYVRPRNKNRPIVDIIHSEAIEGPCIFWSLEKGCSLSYEDRPLFGRALIPIDAGFTKLCKSVYPQTMLITQWKPYIRPLFELAKKFFPKNWEPYKEFKFQL